MAKYRNKDGDVVEAEQFNVMQHPMNSPTGIVRRSATEEETNYYCEWYVLVQESSVLDKDWIITDKEGGKKVCRPDIFEQTYEKVEE